MSQHIDPQEHLTQYLHSRTASYEKRKTRYAETSAVAGSGDRWRCGVHDIHEFPQGTRITLQGACVASVYVSYGSVSDGLCNEQFATMTWSDFRVGDGVAHDYDQYGRDGIGCG